jgi:hypothetical protein
MNNSETDISCDKTQQDGFAFSRISVFDSCIGSSLIKLVPHAGFDGSIQPEIVGSCLFWETAKLARIDSRRGSGAFEPRAQRQ